MIIHSIKWRLQAWHGTLLVLLVAGLLTGFYNYETRSSLAATDTALHEALTPLLPRLAPPGPRGAGGGRRVSEADGNRALVAERFYFAGWNAEGKCIAISSNAPSDLAPPEFSGSAEGSRLRTRGNFREIAHLVPSGTKVLVGTSLTEPTAKLRRLAYALAGIGSSIVIVGLAVGWWLATRALRPLADISRAAQQIAEGDLTRRINPAATESELGQLITVLNSTFARLETAFAHQQQFTSDAAHELRTPVSIILTQVQSTLNKERSGAEYRETLEACQRAAQRMKRLIESLLELARFDAGQEQLTPVRFDLAATTRECVEMLAPLASERRVKLNATLAAAHCSGDAERLSQVIVNLLTNAVTYNQPDGVVRVTTELRDKTVVLTVADTGIGITTADAPHVFKRFYRADKSRAGSAGNAGLGLAICKSIVAAHGGTLDFTSEPQRGTTFTLRLPAA